ncbi:MAG TPA: hypothetical protein DEB73_03225 [Candidatus Magasanikbacteria bacterium]|nr:hypothetical protein [Candidatus Magasanikbacteria bacterium]
MLRFILTLSVAVLFLFVGACAHTSGTGTKIVPASVPESPHIDSWGYNGDIFTVCLGEPEVYQQGRTWAGLFLLESRSVSGCRPPRIVLLSRAEGAVDPIAMILAESREAGYTVYAVPTSVAKIFHTIILRDDGSMEVFWTYIGEGLPCDCKAKPHKLNQGGACSASICGDLYEAVADDSSIDCGACAPFFTPTE